MSNNVWLKKVEIQCDTVIKWFISRGDVYYLVWKKPSHLAFSIIYSCNLNFQPFLSFWTIPFLPALGGNSCWKETKTLIIAVLCPTQGVGRKQQLPARGGESSGSQPHFSLIWLLVWECNWVGKWWILCNLLSSSVSQEKGCACCRAKLLWSTDTSGKALEQQFSAACLSIWIKNL